MEVRERMTFSRRAWLHTLTQGPAVRSSRVGFDCMRLGWTEWHKTADGEPILDKQGRWLERITEKGREALALDA